MKSFRLLLPAACLAAGLAAAADPPKDAPTPPDAETVKAIQDQAAKLAKEIDMVRRQGRTPDPVLADVEIYHKAAAWVLKHNEFTQRGAGPDAVKEVLDRGMLRASQQARGDAPWLDQVGQAVVRAYRSRVDGSLQPYAVTLPAGYGKDKSRWRMDVVLHGRNDDLTEVSFLRAHSGDRPAPAQDWVQIDIYGRGNNAYRWAGETDVQEAIENFLAVEQSLGRGGLIDPARVVLRGFSMGGAGTWHLGLHRPSQWCVIGPGAGFTTTHGYVKDMPEKPPPYQEACLSIYDAVDYAENASDVPVVSYDGSDDPQLQAARNIEEKLKPLGIPMTLLVAPGLKHEFPAEWQKKAEAEYQKYTAKGRPDQPAHVHFVAYTLKYPSCDWVEILGLERHYQRSLVDAERTDKGLTIKTENVRVLHLGVPPGTVRTEMPVAIDGQDLKVVPYAGPNGDLSLYLERRDGKWAAAQPERLLTEQVRTPRKAAGLQGPIDDAFTSSFLCVYGKGKPWNDAVQQYAEADLERFKAEWSKYMRGELPVKEDADVTADDIATRHLILFGDPGSNSLLAQALPGLPLAWTKETIGWKDNRPAQPQESDVKALNARIIVPALIYPSPFSPDHYVVVNSGHTFHAADFKGTNALLYPRLGDYALLKLDSDKKDPLAAEVLEAGVFDDAWRR